MTYTLWSSDFYYMYEHHICFRIISLYDISTNAGCIRVFRGIFFLITYVISLRLKRNKTRSQNVILHIV